MPAGPAFDLAAAALILKGGRVFPSPDAVYRDFPATVPVGGEPVGADRVSCLTLAGDEADGVTMIRRVEPKRGRRRL